MVTNPQMKDNFFLPFSSSQHIWALVIEQLKLQLPLLSKTALDSKKKKKPQTTKLSSYPISDMKFLLTCQAPPGGPLPSTIWGI